MQTRRASRSAALEGASPVDEALLTMFCGVRCQVLTYVLELLCRLTLLKSSSLVLFLTKTLDVLKLHIHTYLSMCIVRYHTNLLLGIEIILLVPFVCR